MTNASVKPALNRIEKKLEGIQEKLCEISPCAPKEPNNQTEESEEE